MKERDVNVVMKKRNPILRPVAWVALYILINLICYAAELIQKLGIYLIGLLSPLPTWAVVLITISFSSVYLGLLGYGAGFLPMASEFVSDWIYPSKSGARYFSFGIFTIIFYLFMILFSASGAVEYPHSKFWYYALYIYDIILMIVLMCCGRTKALERKEEYEKELVEKEKEDLKKTDETLVLMNKLTESEQRNRVILDYSRRTCRQIANVPEGVEFDLNYWPKSINANSCMVYPDKDKPIYHTKECKDRNMDTCVSAFSIAEKYTPCPICNPVQVYGFPKWLTDYWDAIKLKRKYGILDPDIPHSADE